MILDFPIIDDYSLLLKFNELIVICDTENRLCKTFANVHKGNIFFCALYKYKYNINAPSVNVVVQPNVLLRSKTIVTLTM